MTSHSRQARSSGKSPAALIAPAFSDVRVLRQQILINETDLDSIRDFDVLGILNGECAVDHTGDDGAGLLSGRGDRDKGACLRPPLVA